MGFEKLFEVSLQVGPSLLHVLRLGVLVVEFEPFDIIFEQKDERVSQKGVTKRSGGVNHLQIEEKGTCVCC